MSGRIQQHQGFVQVDFSGCALPEMLALCTEFAALCVTARVRCALLQGGDEDMQRRLAVRDLLKMIVVVGMPRDFKLALVPGAPRTRAVYQKSEAELRGAGLDARFFESENLAAQWFGGSALQEARVV